MVPVSPVCHRCACVYGSCLCLYDSSPSPPTAIEALIRRDDLRFTEEARLPVTEAQLEATRAPLYATRDDDLCARTNGLAPRRDLQELEERRKARGALVQRDDDAPQAKIPRGGDGLVDNDIRESRWRTLKAAMLLEGEGQQGQQGSARQLFESDAPRHRGPSGGNE